MENIIYILFNIILILISIDFLKKNIGYGKNQPPRGGIPFPIFGDLPKFGVNPHRYLTKVAKKKGGIFSVWLGDEKVFIITDPEAIRDIWIKQFKNFSDHPRHRSIRIFSGNFNDMAFAEYSLWKINRKWVSSAFTKTKLKTVGDLIERETNYFIDSMKIYSNSGESFYPKKYLSKFGINIVSGLMFSEVISKDESIDKGAMEKLTIPIQAVFKRLGADNLDDFISILGPLFYFQNKKFKRQVQDIYEYLEVIYDQHVTNLDTENPKDLMDLLIISTEGKEKDMIIHIGMDCLLAGSDSTAASCEWFCLFMVNNPSIQKKAYNELKNCINVEKDGKFIPISKRENCPYMQSIFKEVLRMRPVGPLGIPRVALEETTVNGYTIPKGSQVYQNVYGMGHLYVSNPYEFKPERWIEYKKQKDQIKAEEEYELEQQDGADEINYSSSKLNSNFDDLDKVSIPFSLGNRNCPGMSLSELTLFSLCSNILLNFELKSPNGKQLDDTEVFGLTSHTKVHSINLIPR
ncbi:hypothetical protein RB653_001971 [Dictyostelium firmibasis]|uniref:Cytochrome P450 n=1 Tax=Dictyostelium firmibasis TaxID=79012 RepID=A0AAN7TPW0_9MYCE